MSGVVPGSFHCDDGVSGEAEIFVAHIINLAPDDKGADDKDQGDGELKDDEAFSEPPFFAAFLNAAFQAGYGQPGREDPGGIEAGEKRGDEGDQKKEEQYIGT